MISFVLFSVLVICIMFLSRNIFKRRAILIKNLIYLSIYLSEYKIRWMLFRILTDSI